MHCKKPRRKREWLKNVLYLKVVNLNEYYLKIFDTVYKPVSVSQIEFILNFLIIVENEGDQLKRHQADAGWRFNAAPILVQRSFLAPRAQLNNAVYFNLTLYGLGSMW